MTDDFHDFDLRPDFGRVIPEWAFREEPYKCRAFRSAIVEAGGDIPEGEPLSDAFAACSDKINEAAQVKIAALLGDVDEPVAIVAADILP